MLEAFAIERAPDQVAELRIDAARIEVAHQRLQAHVDHRLRGIEAHTPEPVLERACHLERGPDAVILEVDQDHDVDVGIDMLGIFLCRDHAIAAVGGDQRMGNRSLAFAAPPGRLRVGRDADRARHVGAPAVARLH